MNAVIIICSRPESSRLPGKVFRKIAGRMAIQHILDRVSGAGLPIVVAVPPESADLYRPITDAYPDATLFTGDAASPLHRTAKVLQKYTEATYLVRITHDDILIDKQTMRFLLWCAKRNGVYQITHSDKERLAAVILWLEHGVRRARR